MISISSFIFLAKNPGRILSYPSIHFYFPTYAEYMEIIVIVINVYTDILTDFYVFSPVVI
jgi:hypothetical protein